MPLGDFIKKNFDEVIVYTPTKTRAQILAANELGGTVASELSEIEDCDVIICPQASAALSGSEQAIS